MTDITAEILKSEFLEGTIADRFVRTTTELDYRYPNDPGQIDWCIANIGQSLMDWVSAGMIAKWASRYKVWQQKFNSWAEFCTEGLKKEKWQVKKLIEHAEVVVALQREGFDILPKNQSQVSLLLRIAKKLDCLIYEVWDKVVIELPERFITARAIAGVFGMSSDYVRKKLPIEVADRLDRQAAERGLSLEEMLAIDYGLIQDDDELIDIEDDEVEEVEPDKIEAWQEDLEQLVAEHDRDIWLLCTLSKLANFVRSKTSQFSWLRTYRCQT